MSSTRAPGPSRKDVLVARAALQRLRLRHEIDGVRASFAWTRAAGAIAASPQARSLAFAGLLAVAGRGRVARWLRVAATALVVARLARAFMQSRKPAGQPPALRDR